MNESKDAVLKEILSIRRRLSKTPVDVDIQIDRFEEQMVKSLKRIDKVSYLSKKFTREELAVTLKAYEALISPNKQTAEDNE